MCDLPAAAPALPAQQHSKRGSHCTASLIVKPVDLQETSELLHYIEKPVERVKAATAVAGAGGVEGCRRLGPEQEPVIDMLVGPQNTEPLTTNKPTTRGVQTV